MLDPLLGSFTVEIELHVGAASLIQYDCVVLSFIPMDFGCAQITFAQNPVGYKAAC